MCEMPLFLNAEIERSWKLSDELRNIECILKIIGRPAEYRTYIELTHILMD